MQIYVGAALRGDIARYAKIFNLAEIRAEKGKIPRAAVLKHWPQKVPEHFVFSVLLPRKLSTLEASPAEEAEELEYSLSTASALKAAWVVLQTPPSVMPGARSRQKLEQLLQRLSTDTARVAWEPRGLWEDDQAQEFADKIGVSLVRDIRQGEPPESEVVYTRLRALGASSRLGPATVDVLQDALAAANEAFILMEGEGAARVARALRQDISQEEDLDDDEELEDDDESE